MCAPDRFLFQRGEEGARSRRPVVSPSRGVSFSSAVWCRKSLMGKRAGQRAQGGKIKKKKMMKKKKKKKKRVRERAQARRKGGRSEDEGKA